MESRNWAIVGGGIMGMVLAHNLAKLGHKVTIFEAAPELGGLASSWKLGNVEWDKFYHVILLSDMRTRNILNEIGLEEKIQWVETKTGFYIKGKLYSISNLIEFLKFPTLNLIDKFRLGITILVASKINNWERLEKIPVAKWLQKWSGHNTYMKIWLPLLRAKLGDSYEKTSAVFIWATIKRLYGARRNGLKKEMFGYVPGGYKTIIDNFKKKLIINGVSIKLNHSAQEVKTSKGGKPQIFFQNGIAGEFDEVIVTLPSSTSAKLCSGLMPNEIKKLNSIEYLGVICVTLLLDRPVSKFYITNITDSTIPFTGIIEMSALVDKKYFENYSLIYLPKYIATNDSMFQKTDDEIKTYFINSFKNMYPDITESNIKFIGVARAKHVITIANLNYSKNLPGIKTSLPNVYIINTSHIKDGTLNVNETIRVAETKLEEILN
jgi:protoporphyrinogen oxidase